ncbi:MAG: glutathione S-transferase [Sphingomonas sp. 28-63-12]|nr:MAG: glutathione S-transferase [Sphingomonas sp. 28-63-12]
MRARMALLVSGVAVELREVALRRKPEAMIAASPKATVPVLVLADGQVIDESIAIMRWALGQHDPEAWLAGDDAALIAGFDGAFKHHLDRYKYANRHPGDSVDHRAAGLAMLAPLEARLAGHPNLTREHRSIADIAIMPFIRQFAMVDQGWFCRQPLTNLQLWLARHTGSALFDRTMVRTTPWMPGDAPVFLNAAVRS